MGNNSSKTKEERIQFTQIDVEEPLLLMTERARRSVSLMLHPIVKASV